MWKDSPGRARFQRGCLESRGRVQRAHRGEVADVGRALRSISMATGIFDGPGTHDVLFNNKVGVVVPAGIANRILEKVKPIMQHDRRGGLRSKCQVLAGRV